VKRKLCLILLGVAVAAWSGAASAGPNITNGEWEITSKMEMEGMPMVMPPVKTTMCLNTKEAVPQKPAKNQECKMISNKIEGNTVTWVMQCKGKYGTTDSKGRITYKGDSFDGKVIMNMTDEEGTRKMTQKMTGRRIGDCK
jgi:hypothetical protein